MTRKRKIGHCWSKRSRKLDLESSDEDIECEDEEEEFDENWVQEEEEKEDDDYEGLVHNQIVQEVNHSEARVDFGVGVGVSLHNNCKLS